MANIFLPGHGNRNRQGMGGSEGNSANLANQMYMGGLGGGIGGGSATGQLSQSIRNNMRGRIGRGGGRPQGQVRIGGQAPGGQVPGGNVGGVPNQQFNPGGGVTSTSSIPVNGVYSPAQIQAMKNTARNSAISAANNASKQALSSAGARVGMGSGTNASLKAQTMLGGLLGGARGAQDAERQAAEANFGGETQRLGMRSNENLGMWGLADSAKNREAQLELARQNQQLQREQMQQQNNMQSLGMMMNLLNGGFGLG